MKEITPKAIVIALIITVLLASSNVYLALKIGTTVAASIPAAVLSMGILRFFKNHNVLENNIIQTAASAGEGIAGAIAFVLPALIIMHYWDHFNYWDTVGLAALGGLLGVLFSIPLRRVLLSYPGLTYPEGVAVGNVLKAGNDGAKSLKYLVQGGIVGGVISFFQTGIQVIAGSLPLWFVRGKVLFGITLGFDPTMIGAGFIIGPEGCNTMLVGTILVWVIGMPFLALYYGLPNGNDTYGQAMSMWTAHIRYIGIGTMLLGGVWTLLELLKPLIVGIKASFKAMTSLLSPEGKLPRTEQDIPFQYVMWGSLILLLFFFALFLSITYEAAVPMSNALHLGVTTFAVIYAIIGGFFSAAICGYFTGLVGSTNNPISGVLLISVLIISLFFLLIFSGPLSLHPNETKSFASALVIVLTTMIASIATIANDNLQDLKAGQIVGATPWKQQVMLLVGVIASALVVSPILDLLFQAYGIGGVFPRQGMDPTQMLAAPQAGLMAAVAKGVLGHSLPWTDIIIGMILAVVCIIADRVMKRYGHGVPVLAMGLGIYLPPYIIVAIVIGGIIRYIANRAINNRYKDEEQRKLCMRQGVLLACGLVAGSALMGVGLAIPFVIMGSANALRLVSDGFTFTSQWLGLIVMIIMCVWLYRITIKKQAGVDVEG